MESRLRKEQFIDALQNAKFTDREEATIRAIAAMPNHEISQSQLAEALNAKAEVTANRAIGAVGERIATYLNFVPDTTPFGGKIYWFPTISLWDEEKRVWRLHDEMVEALRETGQIPNSPPDRIPTKIRRIKRDSSLVKEIKLLYDYRCQIKGCNYRLQLPHGNYYAEAHHLKPLGGNHNGTDVKGNVLCVCANHHKEMDYGARELHPSDILLHPDHSIDQTSLDYHNACIFKHVVLEESDDSPNESPSMTADAYLATAIRVSNAHRGQTLLAKKLSEMTGKNILRQHIQSWTRRKNKVAPSLGIGLALAKAAEDVAKELGIQTSDED